MFLLPESGDMAGRRILYVIGLAGSAAFYLLYQEWFSWIVLLIVALLPWFSLVLSLGSLIFTKLKLICPSQVEKGCAAKVHVMCNSLLVPISPYQSKIKVTKPATGEKWILSQYDELPTEHCGGLTAELHRAKLYDYLGLFSRKVRLREAEKIFIMPIPEELPVPPDLTRYIARSWRPKHGGGYAENHELRPYHPGDRLNLVHWKLSAKTDTLTVREPMIPDRSRILVTLDFKGTANDLDKKLGQLLWLGSWLLEQQVPFETAVLTGNGLKSWTIQAERELYECIKDLLFAPLAREGSVRDGDFSAAWKYHIGGESDEV